MGGIMKFYKLSESDLPLIFSLSESEIKVWCWLSVNLPFDNSRDLEIDTSQLAEEIGISRRSVQRALKTIQENELFEIEFTKAKVKRKTTQMSSGDTDVAATTQMSPTSSETLAQQGLQISKIIQTYKTYTDSLSEAERESFLEFAKKKASELPKPPTLISKWIKAHWEDLRSQWEKSQGKVSALESNKWDKHPQREEWLEKIRQLGSAGFQAEDMPNQKIRREFYVWADANNLIWGNEA